MGTGGGVGGCTPPLKPKICPTPGGKKTGGGVHPGVRSTPEKKNFDPPVRPFFGIFGQNHPPVYIQLAHVKMESMILFRF